MAVMLSMSQSAIDQMKTCIRTRTPIDFSKWATADLIAGSQTMLLTVLAELDEQARAFAAVVGNQMLLALAGRSFQ